MSQENKLEKTNRINLLFDFYETLLTEKQQTFLKYYFLDDFSLGEIASEFGISRQAVYEHIKRAEEVLEAYEEKLGLLRKDEERARMVAELKRLMEQSEMSPLHKETVMDLLQQVERL
ncbi:putative DNA-binding protein [Paenibacillus motobuensis]|uniref:putative DNA-binding protein n=1 Tax=Paenibacillus TaxID=44249 RepID=UPI002040CCBB|nr:MULTISPECIES: putative DNA-binding protein [Paenibacillus]MCM3038319.1 putative DNA-binding protein [Paenibacillus lutimineralis]MCM3645423.1 putative DNA-binding protein [Paenibacillus motobuensis]